MVIVLSSLLPPIFPKITFFNVSKNNGLNKSSLKNYKNHLFISIKLHTKDFISIKRTTSKTSQIISVQIFCINFGQFAGKPTNEIAFNIIINIRVIYAYLVKTFAFYIKCIKPEVSDEKIKI